jgi:hypothetical protein
MAIQNLKYENENGVIVNAQFDTDYGIRPELSSDEQEWFVLATSPTAEEQTDFSGPALKK